MEAIKLSVDINVNVELSESTRQFIQGLFAGCSSVCSSTSIVEEASKAEASKAEASKAEASKAEASKAEAPKAEAPKAEAPKAEAPKAEAKKLDIEDLRVELKNKVNTHREAIKAKLTELGAPSVTKLAEDKYEEMYNFLIALPNE